MKDQYILGISAYYHDSAACLLRNGEIIAAAQEKRFTRKKGDADIPRKAVDYCLGAGGVAVSDLAYATALRNSYRGRWASNCAKTVFPAFMSVPPRILPGGTIARTRTGKVEIDNGEYYTFHTLFQDVTSLRQFLTGQQWGIVYFGLITPIGFLIRLFGKNPLKRHGKNGSYWVRRPSAEGHAQGMERQF